MADTITAAPGAAQSTLTLDTASQAGSLDDLASLAAGLEGPAATAPGGSPTAPGALQAQRQTNAQLIASALGAGRDGFCAFTELQSPRATMSDAKCREVGELWGAWCDRRGIDLAAKMGEHGDTLAASLATFMLGAAVVQAVRMELATRKPVDAKPKGGAEPAAAPPPAPAPAGGNVSVFPGAGGRVET